MVNVSNERILISMPVSVSNHAESNPWTLGNDKNNKIETTGFRSMVSTIIMVCVTYVFNMSNVCLLYTSKNGTV